MTNVSNILSAINEGDQRAAESLLPIVYDELRKLASARLSKEPNGQSLQPTELVHEAYLRLVNIQSQKFDSHGHFFAAAAEAMRRILVDRARRKGRAKHGGDRLRVPMNEELHAAEENSYEVLAIHEALGKFEQLDEKKAELVKMRYFVGMTLEEAAGVLNISRATAVRHWAFAKAWLAAELNNGAM